MTKNPGEINNKKYKSMYSNPTIIIGRKKNLNEFVTKVAFLQIQLKEKQNRKKGEKITQIRKFIKT